MSITYHKGDLLNSKCDMICHQVNLQGIFGGGIAKQIATIYPDCETDCQEFIDFIRADCILGKFTIYSGTDMLIANCFTQNDYFETIESAIERCFSKLLAKSKFKKLKTIGIPKNYGCGIAKGDWEVVEQIFRDIFENEKDIELQIWELQKNNKRRINNMNKKTEEQKIKSKFIGFRCPPKLEELILKDAENSMSGYSGIIKAILIKDYTARGLLNSDKENLFRTLEESNERIEELENENEELKKRLENSVELPCKVGDTVYWLDMGNRINKETVYGFTIGIINKNNESPVGHFGSGFYLTREKAEQRLKELRNEK